MNTNYTITQQSIVKTHKLHVDTKDWHNIIFTNSKTLIAHYNGRQLLLNQGNIMLMQPNQKLSLQITKESQPSSIIWLKIKESHMALLSNEETDLVKSFNQFPYKVAVIPSDIQTSMLLKNLAKRLIDSEQNPKFGHSLMTNGILSIFLTLILRLCISADLHSPQQKQSPLMIDHVFIYIREHLQEDLSLKQLEKVFYVSHEHLSREFKKQTGQTIHSYIKDLRLEQSCQLLKKDLPITQIWQRCGFSSYSYYFQAFKKKYNLTPKEYRLQTYL